MNKFDKFLYLVTKMYMTDNKSKNIQSTEATPIIATRRQWSKAIVESLDFKNLICSFILLKLLLADMKPIN